MSATVATGTTGQQPAPDDLPPPRGAARAVWKRRLAGAGVVGVLLLATLVRGATATAGDTFVPPLGVDVPTSSAKTITVKPGEAGGDFDGTEITVSQTRDLGNQGITISWKNAPSTPDATIGQNVFAFMQCWGDPDAPDPFHEGAAKDPLWGRETCQFGALLDTPVWGGDKAPGGGTIRTVGINGLPDPAETLPPDAVIAPFRSVKGTRIGHGGKSDPYPGNLDPQTTGSDVIMSEYFDKNKTNEIPYGYTAGDGTGRVVFEAQTDMEAPHLGCGLPDSGGVIQPCWLVIVPRGHHDPLTGGELAGSDTPVNGSPLAATHWKHRIAVRLDFRSVQTPCPIDQAERATVGSEMAAPAMQAWQPALCGRTGNVYGYTPTSEDETSSAVLGSGDDSPGLGFTSSPVVGVPGGPPPVHAPMALSSVVVAFTIDNQVNPGSTNPEEELLRARQVNGMRLTPKLVAKLLTSSYQRDIPDGSKAEHLKDNYRTILADPEFITINPDFRFSRANRDIQPVMVPLGGSAANRAVWGWILADKAARDFLSGVPDPEHKDPVTGVTYHMKVNSFYQDFGLDGVVPDRFPKSDPTCSQPRPDLVPELKVCIFNKQPYTSSMTDGAQQTLKADTHSEVEFDEAKYQSSDHQIVTLKRAAPQTKGNRWVMAITDSASAARFGLYSASLLNGSDPTDLNAYVTPTKQSLQAAVAAMGPTANPDVLALDPALKKPGAYPLTMLTYAAVDPSRGQALREAYAKLIEFAAGDGQNEGVSVGNLPPGYVPLPDSLKAKARSAAEMVRRGWTAPPTPAATTTTAAPVTGGTLPARGSVPSAAPTSARPSLSAAPVPAARATDPEPVEWAQRYLLSMILGAGLLAAAAGPVLTGLARRRERR
ncbi:hypothetical protein GCM10009827_052410 [Dactylosporangium maewongense]|uniref:PBP domain-containing protein n=1 Tax=Dactylosporangium maewongense TaxID=634393 RepID=A0ABN2AXR7_9ACTN